MENHAYSGWETLFIYLVDGEILIAFIGNGGKIQ